MFFVRLFSVTGPYLKRIFQSELGTGDESVINADPLEDFGGMTIIVIFVNSILCFLLFCKTSGTKLVHHFTDVEQACF